ncbi:MAG: hypothetical protein M3Y24_05595 [Acidobacteriota bacterium]|nr:hypothetical protein [Acidobacteriota bacterium]
MTRRAMLLAAAAALKRPPANWIALALPGRTQTQNWAAMDKPVPMGSLLKPFLVLAYGITHTQFPVAYCRGATTGCWYAHGHGTQNVVDALANSCNTYFLALASAIDSSALESICLIYGLRASPRLLPAPNLIGLGPGWPQAPRDVVRAFANLAENASDPHVRLVLTGMTRCADTGTARALGLRAYAKTGTAACSHLPRASGDGFAVAIYPPDQPRHRLLVQRHNVTGAIAARDIKPLSISVL